MKNVSITLALALALALPLSLPAQVKRAEQSYAAAIEFSPISPLFDIYAVQYARNLGEGSELFAGLSYANVKYDHGRSHAPGLILGARRYMWNRFHIEYQLWPSYNWYYESDEQEYYRGPELWNEFRVGYTVDFAVSGQPLFINLQYLLGFGLYGGNKPESFQRQAQEEPLFPGARAIPWMALWPEQPGKAETARCHKFLLNRCGQRVRRPLTCSSALVQRNC